MSLTFKEGIPLARIRRGDKVNVLKFKDHQGGEMSEKEKTKKFGAPSVMESMLEKLLGMDEMELRMEMMRNPALKKRIYDELDNENCRYYIDEGKSINLKGSSFNIAINPKDYREVVYIFGKSGCGKSVICRDYIKEYRMEFPANPVYVFSLKDSDPAFDDLGVIRIPYDLDVLSKIDNETLEESLCIFDDTDTELKSKEANEINRLKDDIIQRGRSARIFCLITTHMGCNYAKTRTVLNECDKIISFPGRVAPKHFKYLFENYGGMTKHECDQAWKLPSRWVSVSRTYPRHVIYESGGYLLS